MLALESRLDNKINKWWLPQIKSVFINLKLLYLSIALLYILYAVCNIDPWGFSRTVAAWHSVTPYLHAFRYQTQVFPGTYTYLPASTFPPSPAVIQALWGTSDKFVID